MPHEPRLLRTQRGTFVGRVLQGWRWNVRPPRFLSLCKEETFTPGSRQLSPASIHRWVMVPTQCARIVKYTHTICLMCVRWYCEMMRSQHTDSLNTNAHTLCTHEYRPSVHYAQPNICQHAARAFLPQVMLPKPSQTYFNASYTNIIHTVNSLKIAWLECQKREARTHWHVNKGVELLLLLAGCVRCANKYNSYSLSMQIYAHKLSVPRMRMRTSVPIHTNAHKSFWDLAPKEAVRISASAVFPLSATNAPYIHIYI